VNTAHNTSTNKHARSHTLRTGINALSLSIALAFSLAPVSSWAQEPPVNISIAAQPLGEALLQLGQQTSLQIFFSQDVAAGLNARPVSGNLEPEQALRQLLEGTGIRYVRDGNNITLSRPAEVGTVMLSPVVISGKAIGSTTEGTGSYTTYSTSSATRLNLSIRETPQSATVMTRQRMDDQRLESLEDILQATPGASVRYISGYGTDAPSTYVRGTVLNSYQIDGVRTSSSMQSYMQSTAIYDRVEIVRGATGLMNSLGSPAATINMVRKRPTDEPQIKLSAETGNWDRYGGGLDISGSLTESGNIRGRVVADYKRQGNWTDHYEQDYYTLYGIGEFDLSDNTLLTAGFSHITRDTEGPSSTTPLFYADGQRVSFNASDNGRPSWQYHDNELNNAFVSVEHQFDSGWSGKAEISHTQFDSNSLYAGNTILSGPSGGVDITVPWREQPTRKETTFDAYVTGPFSLFGREHELIGGINLSDLQSETPSYRVSWSGASSYHVPDYFNFTNTVPKPNQITETGIEDLDETQYSAYISLRFHLSDATSLLLGGRVTDWDRETESTTYATGARTKNEKKKTGLFVPYAGIVHDLNDTWSLYASYTKIFNPQVDRFRDINGETLDPQEGISYETGVKASFYEGRLNASLSLYKTELDNFASWYFADGRTIYEGVDGTETEGVELEINGELAEGWQIGGGYSYNEVRDPNDNRLNTAMSDHIVKIFSSYRLPGALNKVTVGGGFDWMSSRKDQEVSLGSYTLASLMARYEVSQNLSVSANINNLFDKEYFQAFQGGGYGAYAAYGSYGPPRNFMISLDYTY